MSYLTKPRSDWAQVRDAIIALMLTADGVDYVHNRLRYNITNIAPSGGSRQGRGGGSVNRWAQLLTPPEGDFINAWSIIRGSQERTWLTNREIQVDTNVIMHGWYQLDDEADSQAAFDLIVDNLVDVLESAIRLGGDDIVNIQGPTQIPEEDHLWIGDTLVHHAQVTTVAQEVVLVTSFT